MVNLVELLDLLAIRLVLLVIILQNDKTILKKKCVISKNKELLAFLQKFSSLKYELIQCL